MARKSIKGYAEKNYYDNTRFNGGIVATNDPLNEGSFKHLVNFDISDMGQSITPRKGFLTTTIKGAFSKEGLKEIQSLSDETIYFYDESLGEYIFFDLRGTSSTTLSAWRVKFNVEDNFITDCVHINNVDFGDLGRDFLTNGFTLINTNQAIRIIDEYSVTSYIIKVKNLSDQTNLWLKLYYRKDTTSYDGITFPEDTLVISYLDTDDVVNYVDITQRNLASDKSIIPTQLQEIYTKDNKPDGHVNTLPMIYVKDTNDNYIINNVKSTVEGLTIIPNFYIEEAPENYIWAYTYDITAYSTDIPMLSNPRIHNGYVYSVKDNSLIIPDRVRDKSFFETYYEYLYNKKRYLLDIQEDDTLSEYRVYLSSLNMIISDNILIDTLKDTVILYMVPKTKDDIVRTIMPEITIDDETDEEKAEYLPDFLWMIGMHNVDLADNDEGKIIEQNKYLEYYYSNNTSHNMWDEYATNIDTTTLYINDLTACYSTGSDKEAIVNNIYLNNLYTILEKYKDTHRFYVVPLVDAGKDILSAGNSSGYYNIIQTALLSNMIAFEQEGMTLDELRTELKNYTNIVLQPFTTSTKVCVNTNSFNRFDCANSKKYIENLFPNLSEGDNIYYLYTKYVPSYDGTLPTKLELTLTSPNINLKNIIKQFFDLSLYYEFFKIDFSDKSDIIISADPVCIFDNLTTTYFIRNSIEDVEKQSLFKKESDLLYCVLDSASNPVYYRLSNINYFNSGLIITFYLMKIPTRTYVNSNSWLSSSIEYTRDYFLNTTNLIQSKTIAITDTSSIYTLELKDEPEAIELANNYLIFNSPLGDHLVVYKDNKVFISKEGMPHYFTYDYMKEYPEPVVKVIQYKDMLLVFTVQNLYAIYFYEDTTLVTTIDEEGNSKDVQQKILRFATLPVLYNLMINEQYKDAIQVYNQMILFYSSDGQMFLIKPTAAIDSNTRFSIQYFNKSANDILLNYKDYMQERLKVYGWDKIINDVTIKVIANINYIKIFYSAKDIMTYVLVYDVLNNRYYTYDTLAFNDIKHIHYIPTGELYITEHDNKLYFTLPHNNIYDVDSNVDTSYYNNFTPYPIQSEIDTGVINLNNHLKKRFKDLHVIYKNLNANNVEFKLETFVDDVPIITYIGSNFEVQNVSGFDSLTITESNKVTQLVDNTALFNFIDYTSNKIITHRSNIVSKGKTIRIRMNFSSKGKYKIQGYGLIYKEHTV